MAINKPQKNMLFYVCPTAKQPDLWRRCCRRLLDHIDIFDGVRTICISQGDGLEPKEAVLAEFAGNRLDNVLVGQNDLTLYEAAHWHNMLETVAGAPGITWFGHTKGISYTPDQWGIQTWVEACFEITLTSPVEVERTLCDEHYLTTGPFLLQEPKQKWGPWCYSGTFYWFHNRVFDRKWRVPVADRWAVETWPAQVSSIGEGKCMCCLDAALLWKKENWFERRSKEVAQWRDARTLQRRRDDPPSEDRRPSLNIITPCSRPENLSRIWFYLNTRIPSFDVKWHVIFDGSHVPSPPEVPGAVYVASESRRNQGSDQRNNGLEQISEGLVWFLDDDNIPHPDFDKALRECLASAPSADVYAFGQTNAWGIPIRLATPENMRKSGVDMAQLVIRRDAIGGARFPSANMYENDWEFFKSILEQSSGRIHFGPVATIYNALR